MEKKYSRSIFSDKSFYLKLLPLAIPITMQNFITSSFQVVDTVMIGRLGEVEIAGVGLAGQIVFILILILFAIGSGSAIFTAQYWGKKDIPRIRQVAGLSMGTALTTALIFTLACSFFPETLIAFFSKDPAVIEKGGQYLRIVSLGFPLLAFSFTISMTLRSMEQTIIPLAINIVSLAFNAFFNFCLIFGKFGFPRMGVAGAALATTASRGLEVILGTVILLAVKHPLTRQIKDYFSLDWETARKVIKMILPVILNEMVWGLGVSIYSLIYARVGTETIAAYRIAATVMDLFFVAVLGMGNSCATMIGNTIGEGDKERAYVYAVRFLKLALLVGLIIGGLMVLCAKPITLLFSVSEEARAMARGVLYVYAIAVIIKSATLHLIVGIFRSGGDARIGMILDLIGVWGIGIPLALFGFLVLKWDLPAVYALVSVEEIMKLIYGFFRLRSRKWINDLTSPPNLPELERFGEM